MRPVPSIRGARIGNWLLVAIVGLAAAAFYFWTSTSNAPLPCAPGPQSDYYNLLVRGLRSGHLYMDATPDPALIAMAPEKRPGAAPYLLDASLYAGHYYLYFGVTPAVTVFLPYALLTGRELPVELAVAAQATLGCWLGLALLLLMRGEFFPRASRLSLAVAALAFAFATAAPMALRKSEVYEAAVTAGFLWGMALLYFSTLAILFERRRTLWLACASLSAGLAVGSRPNLLAGAGALGVALAWLWWREGHGKPLALRVRWVVAAVLPSAVCGAGLALYNYARFGDPLEFGHRFQVGSIADNYVSARYFLHNLTVYYLTPPSAGWFFPFFSPGPEGVRPAGYIGIEYINGEWWFLPWLVALPVLGAIFWQRLRRVESLVAVVGVLAFWFVANFALVACVSARANRYLLDFHPALVLLAGVALLAWSGRRGAWRVAFGGGALALLAAIVVNVMTSFQVHEFFRLDNPATYAAIERVANRLVWPLHRLTSPPFGALAMEVTFPNVPAGQREPLLSTGAPLLTNTITVVTLGPGRARLEFDHEGEGGASGPEFAFVPGRAHEMKIWLGSLVPPAGHPWFEGTDAVDVQRQKQNVIVQLDGQTIFFAGAIPHEASPGQILVGERRVDYTSQPAYFTGRLENVRRRVESMPVPGLAAPEEPFVYNLKVLLPRDRFGVAEPLLSTGVRSRGDVLLVEYSNPTTVRFGHDQIGGGIEWSGPVSVDYAAPQDLTIAFETDGAFDPLIPVDGSGLRPIIRLGSRDVLRGKNAHHAFVGAQVVAGCNTVCASSCRLYFGGTILAWDFNGDGVRRDAIGADGWTGTRAEFSLARELSASSSEPLLAYCNAAGARGVLAVRSAGAGEVQLGWIEAGMTTWSGKIPAAFAAPVQLEVRWHEVSKARRSPSGEISAEEFLRGRTCFYWNGVSVFQPRLEFFDSPVVATAGWRSAFGARTDLAGRFSGEVGRAAAHTSPPLAVRANSVSRSVRLAVRFPADRTGMCEPLLTTGRSGAADGVFIRYGAAGRVSFGFDHWGTGGPESAPIEVDFMQPHELELTLGDGIWERGGAGPLRVRLDGRTVIEAQAKFHTAHPGEIVFGENSVGLSTSVPEFSGVLISLEGQ